METLIILVKLLCAHLCSDLLVKHLCAKAQKIKIFPRGNDNICKKNRTFVTEYVSYTRREVRTNRDTKPLSSKNVRQSGQLIC